MILLSRIFCSSRRYTLTVVTVTTTAEAPGVHTAGRGSVAGAVVGELVH